MGAASSSPADPEAFLWGADLFNHGYYWEAHEAWEDLWREQPKDSPDRTLLHGLILLAAAGVKLREHKVEAARRHGLRAASFFRAVAGVPASARTRRLGLPLPALADATERAVLSHVPAPPSAVAFPFALGSTPSRSSGASASP